MRRTALAAAELRVAQARSDLRGGLRRLRSSLSRPSCLAAAALVGFALGRRDGTGVVAGMLAKTLLGRGAAHLIARSAAQASNPVR
jgi:hypothetical protein